MRGSINKSPIKLSMQQKINWHGDLFTNVENHPGKTPPGDFKVITPENSLLSQQAQVKESQYLISTYSWTLTPIPNWTCSIVTISHFHCVDPSIRLTNCANPSTRLQSPIREGCWLQSSSVHHTVKIDKLLGHKILRCTNTAASSQERWTRANFVFGYNLHEQTLLNACATCVPFNGP